MQTLGRVIKPRNSIAIPFRLSLRHTSTLSPPHQHHPPNPAAAPTTSYYDILVNEAGRSQDLRRVRHLLISRINDRCFNSKNTFNFITSTQSSLSLLDDLFECLASLPRGLPRMSAFESFISRLCKLGHITDALQVFDKMRQRNLELRTYTFHPILLELTKKKDTEGALRMLKAMREIGIKPDTTAYNYLLTAFCVKGEVASAVDLLEKMVGDDELKGDTRTYDALVLGACRAGKVDGAVAVVLAAIDDGVKLMYCTYAHVIKALLEEGYYAQAVKFVMSFAGWERGVDMENFELLGNGLLKLERFEEAKMVVDEMSKRGLPIGHKLRNFYHLNGADY